MGGKVGGVWRMGKTLEKGERGVMDMVIFRTIFFELLVFFTFTFLTLHSAY